METTTIRVSADTRRLLGLALRWGKRSSVGSVGALVAELAVDEAKRILATKGSELSEVTTDAIAAAIYKVDSAPRGRVTKERLG